MSRLADEFMIPRHRFSIDFVWNIFNMMTSVFGAFLGFKSNFEICLCNQTMAQHAILLRPPKIRFYSQFMNGNPCGWFLKFVFNELVLS